MSRSPHSPKSFWREDRRLLIGALVFAVAAFVVDRLVHVFGIVR